MIATIRSVVTTSRVAGPIQPAPLEESLRAPVAHGEVVCGHVGRQRGMTWDPVYGWSPVPLMEGFFYDGLDDLEPDLVDQTIGMESMRRSTSTR